MKPIILNFLSVIRRFKVAVVLNVLGLSVAFAAFMVILIQLDYDLGFDKFHENHDKIYRVEFARQTYTQAVINRPLAERFFESSPHILAGAISNPRGRETFFHVENEGVRNFYEETVKLVSPEYTDVFTFDIAEGVDGALKTPNTVIIPLSLSRKIFGNESAVGKQMVTPQATLTVGAVYRDFPSNTVIENCIYSPIPDDLNKLGWGSWNYHVFIRVNDPVNVPQLFENFKRNFDASAATAAGQTVNWDDNYLRLTALPDIHYTTDVQYDSTPKASKQTLLILFAIAIVIVAIAAINFTNFSTALTPMRIKNINTQRVLGARRNSLRFIIASEAVVIAFLSWLLAVLSVSLFSHTQPANLVDADLSLAAHPLIVGGTALVALLTGVFAGVYPAHYMTSFAPVMVLKGSFGLSPKGKKLRNTLMSIQFAASFALIIGASFMYLQNHFMQNSSLGYEKDALVTVNIRELQGNRDAFTNQLKTFSGIEGVTYAADLLSGTDNYQKWARKYKGEEIQFTVLPVDYTFLETIGIEITEGRNFRREDANTAYGAYVFNEMAHKNYALELNTSIGSGAGDEFLSAEIVGFMPDIKVASFRTAIEPMAFYVMGTEWNYPAYTAYIKLHEGTNLHAAIAHIQSTLAAFNPDYTFTVRFFDEVLQRLYEKETALSSLISLFSMIAIFISIVGVFGLVVFDSECRRKEIGIRKVLGASVLGIIIMFNKAYFRILLICFVIAAPLAWYAVTRWLENFAYKTPMHWWVYLLAFVAVGIITGATVTFQNWRVANDDPVKAIKSE